MGHRGNQYGEHGNTMKTIGLLVAVAGLLVSMSAGIASFAKSYYVTPVMLEDHDKKIQRLEHNAEAMALKLQEQRELLLEIRGDLKMVIRDSKRNIKAGTPATE